MNRLALILIVAILASIVPVRAQTPLRISGNIKPPQKTKHVNPVYPPIAQSARVQGIVIIEATIGPRGQVIDAQLLRSIPLLDNAAIEAVKGWEFTPTLLNGVPVPVIMTVTVSFILSDGPSASKNPDAPGGGPVPPPGVALSSPGHGLPASQPSVGWSPTLPGGGQGAACTGAANGLRWETFPIRVYIEEVELKRRGYSEERTRQIIDSIMTGLGSWALATNGRVGTLQREPDFSRAQLNVVFRNGTGNAIHDLVEGNLIRHATIMMDILKNESWGPAFTQTFQGSSFTDGANHRIVNTAAHEMGHALGIVQHPTTPGSLMIDSPEQLIHEAPQAADVNAILKKYDGCGPTRATEVPVPAPVVPTPAPTPAGFFSGRWECQVDGGQGVLGTGAFSMFVAKDGMVSMAGAAEDMHSVRTASSISFESGSGGFIHAVDLRGTSARLSGTRTMAVPGIPATTYRVTCVPKASSR